MEIPSEQRNDVSTLSDQKGQNQIDQNQISTDHVGKLESSIAPRHKFGKTDEETVCKETANKPSVTPIDGFTMDDQEVELNL